MKKIYIVGAGGFGREVYDWAKETFSEKKYTIVGFLDDNLKALDPFISAENIKTSMSMPPIVGKIIDYQYHKDDWLICAIANPKIKKEICINLINKGGKFLKLIHPSAKLGNNTKIGDGSIICPNVIITNNVNLKGFVSINISTTIGHDVQVGEWTTVSAQCDLTGCVKVGSEVLIGSGARIIPGKIVGDCAIIGAGAVVIRKIPNNQTVFGNPARPLI